MFLETFQNGMFWMDTQRRKKEPVQNTLTGSQKRDSTSVLLHREKKMGVAAPMVERGTWLLCVSSHYNAVSYALYGDSPDREAVSACLRVPGRVPYRVKSGLGWWSPGPIYITLGVGESASLEKEREEEKSDWRSKNNKGARETATWRI